MIIILLLGLALAPFLLLFILWVRLAEWLRSRRPATDQSE
jgi:hypothetical protein